MMLCDDVVRCSVLMCVCVCRVCVCMCWYDDVWWSCVMLCVMMCALLCKKAGYSRRRCDKLGSGVMMYICVRVIQ